MVDWAQHWRASRDLLLLSGEKHKTASISAPFFRPSAPRRTTVEARFCLLFFSRQIWS